MKPWVYAFVRIDHQHEQVVIRVEFSQILAQHRNPCPSHYIYATAQLQDSNHPQNIILGSHSDWVHCFLVMLTFDYFCDYQLVLKHQFGSSGRLHAQGEVLTASENARYWK